MVMDRRISIAEFPQGIVPVQVDAARTQILRHNNVSGLMTLINTQ